MKKTTNLGLSLYDPTDKFTITAAEDSLNHNMELLDKALSVKSYMTVKDTRIETSSSESMTIKVGGVSDLTTAKISVYGRNLLTYPYYHTSFERRGITLTDNGDGSFVINGTTTAGAELYFHMAYNTKPISLKKGKYTIKFTDRQDANVSIVLQFPDSTSAQGANSTGSMYPAPGETRVVEILKDTTCNIYLMIPAERTFNNVMFRPQIELGTQESDFVPYVAPVQYTPDSNGEITIQTVSPTTTIFTSDENMTLQIPCDQKMNESFDELREEFEQLKNNLYPSSTPTVIDNFQSLENWKIVSQGTLTCTLEADTTDFVFGSQSARFTGCIQNDNVNITLKEELRIRFKINSIDSGAKLLFYVADDKNFTNYSTWTLYNGEYTTEALRTNSSVQLGEWVEWILPWGGLENRDFLKVVSTIKTLRFRFLGGNGSANIQFIASEPIKEPRGVLSLTFDDGCKAIYTKAAKILGARGLKATAYIIPELVGVSENCVTEDQLVSLKHDYGWDIEGHWGERMDSYTEEQLASSFSSVKTWIKDRGLGDCDHFAYASGFYDNQVEKVARRHFKTARSIAGIHIRGTDSTKLSAPYRIKSWTGISDTSDANSYNFALERITAASQYGGWVVLTFHDIGDTATSMFCSEEGFTRLVDHAIASGIEIKTVAEVAK